MVIANNVEEVLVQLYSTTADDNLQKEVRDHVEFVLDNVLRRIQDDDSMSEKVKTRVNSIGKTQRGTKALVSILAILNTDNDITRSGDDVNIVRSIIIEAYHGIFQKQPSILTKLFPSIRPFPICELKKCFTPPRRTPSKKLMVSTKKQAYKNDPLVGSIPPHRRETELLGQIRERPMLRKTTTVVAKKTGFLSKINITRAPIKEEEHEDSDEQWKEEEEEQWSQFQISARTKVRPVISNKKLIFIY